MAVTPAFPRPHALLTALCPGKPPRCPLLQMLSLSFELRVGPLPRLVAPRCFLCSHLISPATEGCTSCGLSVDSVHSANHLQASVMGQELPRPRKPPRGGRAVCFCKPDLAIRGGLGAEPCGSLARGGGFKLGQVTPRQIEGEH